MVNIMQLLFVNHGMEVLIDGRQYYLRFHTGGHADYIKTIKITGEEAEEIKARTELTELNSFIMYNLRDRIYE